MNREVTKTICIVGGGALGLSAAYYLSTLFKKRVRITLLESSNSVGGLAASHQLFNGEHIESYYHHIFQTDTAFRDLCGLLGLSKEIFFERVTNGHYCPEGLFKMDGPIEILKGKFLSPLNRFRLLAASLYLKLGLQKRFKNQNALEGSYFLYGEEITDKIWKPLLKGKFGQFQEQVPMSWLASRIRDRSLKLGYFKGGFQNFYKAIAGACEKQGVSIKYKTRAISISSKPNGVEVNGTFYDACFSTIGPVLEKALLGENASAPIKYLGAICVIYEFDGCPALPYWTNYCDPVSPVLAVINHRKLDNDQRLGNCHPVYAAAYLSPDDKLFTANDQKIKDLFNKPIKALLDKMGRLPIPNLIRATVYRSAYAQPLINPDLGLPPIIATEGPLYSASMHSIYPNDRGQNYAVKLGLSIANKIGSDLLYL